MIIIAQLLLSSTQQLVWFYARLKLTIGKDNLAYRI